MLARLLLMAALAGLIPAAAAPAPGHGSFDAAGTADSPARPLQASAPVPRAATLVRTPRADLYAAFADYFRLPESEILDVQDRRIADDEIPVVFLLARQGRATPAEIVRLRKGGSSWLDIASGFGLRPEVFYVPARGISVTGPPYSRAYGYWKDRTRYTTLTDSDVINLVNLKFLSEYHRAPIAEIIRRRSRGESFGALHRDFVRRASARHGSTPGIQRSGDQRSGVQSAAGGPTPPAPGSGVKPGGPGADGGTVGPRPTVPGYRERRPDYRERDPNGRERGAEPTARE